MVRATRGFACLGKIGRFGVAANEGNLVAVYLQLHRFSGVKDVLTATVHRPAFLLIEREREEHTIPAVVLKVVAGKFHDVRSDVAQQFHIAFRGAENQVITQRMRRAYLRERHLVADVQQVGLLHDRCNIFGGHEDAPFVHPHRGGTHHGGHTR